MGLATLLSRIERPRREVLHPDEEHALHPSSPASRQSPHSFPASAADDADTPRHQPTNYERVPRDPARGYAAGSAPYRILVTATDAFAGRGVVTHVQSLVGRLARELCALTGHGIDVEVAKPSVVSPVDAIGEVRASVRDTTDAVLVELEPDLITGSELFEMGAELRTLRAALSPRAQLILLVQSPVPEAAAARLDRLLARADAAFHVHVLPARATDARTTYSMWAHGLSIAIAGNLHFPLHWVAGPEPVDDGLRLRAIERLTVRDEVWIERLQSVVDRAQATYGVTCAAVSLVGQEVVRHHPRVGPVPSDTERSQALSTVTLAHYGGLIVGDARLDTRFDALPSVVSGCVRYYAAQRIRDPQGVPIGALSVWDERPRSVTHEHLEPLRALAAEAERVIAVGTDVGALKS